MPTAIQLVFDQRSSECLSGVDATLCIVCMCTCSCGCTFLWMHVRGQSQVSFPFHFIFWDRVLLTRMAGQRVQGACLSLYLPLPFTGVIHACCRTYFYIDVWEPNSAPHACMASTLWTNPSPQVSDSSLTLGGRRRRLWRAHSLSLFFLSSQNRDFCVLIVTSNVSLLLEAAVTTGHASS